MQLLPRRGREGIGRLLKADKVLAEPDKAARAAYEDRAAHSEPARPGASPRTRPSRGRERAGAELGSGGREQRREREPEHGHEADLVAAVLERLGHHRVGEHAEDRPAGERLDAGDDRSSEASPSSW